MAMEYNLLGKHLVTIGLVSDIVGVFFLFRVGSWRAALIGKWANANQAEEKAKYNRWDKWGVGLLVFGFSLQIVGNYSP